MAEPKASAGPGSEKRKTTLFFLWAVSLPIVLMVSGVALAHFEVVPPMKGFLIYALAGLVSLIHAALLLLMRVVLKKPRWAIVGAAAIPFLLVVISATPGIGVPQINDISTDLDNPPQFNAVAKLPENEGRDMAFPPKFADEIRKGYPQLKSYSANGPQPTRKKLFDAALTVAKSQPGWIIVRTNADEGIIEGTAVTRLIRFRDDFVIRVSEKNGKATLDMRSKSRDGKGDLGANAKRIAAFIDQVRSTLESES